MKTLSRVSGILLAVIGVGIIVYGAVVGTVPEPLRWLMKIGWYVFSAGVLLVCLSLGGTSSDTSQEPTP